MRALDGTGAGLCHCLPIRGDQSTAQIAASSLKYLKQMLLEFQVSVQTAVSKASLLFLERQSALNTYQSSLLRFQAAITDVWEEGLGKARKLVDSLGASSCDYEVHYSELALGIFAIK